MSSIHTPKTGDETRVVPHSAIRAPARRDDFIKAVRGPAHRMSAPNAGESAGADAHRTACSSCPEAREIPAMYGHRRRHFGVVIGWQGFAVVGAGP